MSFIGSTSSGTPHFPAWQREYEAVLSETDGLALFKRVEVAESAILTRREDLERSSENSIERQALENALVNLARIKKNELKFD